MRPFNPSYIFEVLPQLIPYLGVTISMTVGTVLLGSILGLLLAAFKIRKGKIGKIITEMYIYVIRCVPSIVMLFVIYYGLPKLLLCVGLDINDVGKGFFVIITYTILFSATIAEVFRSAYELVDKGQREAALSIGLSEWQTFYRIILPQCSVAALPNFANSLVSIIKEGSLAYTVGLIDIMGKGQLIISKNQGSYSVEIYISLAVLYWILTILIEQSFKYLEKRLAGERI